MKEESEATRLARGAYEIERVLDDCERRLGRISRRYVRLLAEQRIIETGGTSPADARSAIEWAAAEVVRERDA